MFHPVGPQPPTVYWRRRLVMLGAVATLLVLLVMTVKIATSSGDQPAGAQGTVTSPVSSSQTHRSSSSAAASSSHSSSGAASSPARSTSSAPPPVCAAKDLAVSAVVGKTSYQVGDQPLLEMQVTNIGAKPCVQDLADRQVELRVYNGESRVWGSHDCKVQPGSHVRTLPPNAPVRVAITWSGLSSRPACAGTRQRVGAGTYTLYALLAGRTGKATQFTIG